MKIEETFQIESPPQKVWDFVVDPHQIGSCLPSVQSVEVVDESHYKTVVKQKVGFISATFEIHTEVVEKEPPRRLVLSNQGKTILGAHGSLTSLDTITLTPVSDHQTEVAVVSEIKLRGQLAILGAKLIEAKSKEIFAEAIVNLKKKLAAA